VGYSLLVGLDDAGTAARLRRLRRELIEPTIVQNAGTIRQTAGDSLLALFDSIEGAVQSAIAIQRGVATLDKDAPSNQRIRFRIGINIGDAILEEVDMHGDGVNIAVRLESVCPPGSVCVSRTVRDHARHQPDLRFERLGALMLKNISRPIEAFVLHFDETPATGPIAAIRRLLTRRIHAWRLRRIGAASALVLVAIATVIGAFYARQADLPQRQELARAEARHTEEMERLQALNATERSMAETLAREKGVPIAALTQILARLGETVKSDDPVEVQTRLEQKAAEYATLRQQVLMLSADDPKVVALRQEADSALSKADFDMARAKLLDAANIDRMASLALVDRASERSLAAARSFGESARVAALTLHYRYAADDLGKAVALALPFDRHEAWRLMTRQAEMLRSQGDEFGDNTALTGSIDLYNHASQLVPRDEAAQDWARTQTGLGVALRILGEREGETGHLKEAVAAFRAALEERPRQNFPLLWAETQNSLGFALMRLSEREGETAHLEEAVTAFQAALQERTRERVPLQWVVTQNLLGTALLYLGQRESGTAHLEEAINAYRGALQEATRERVPLQWAMTQNLLGTALLYLGQRESGTAHLEEAINAYRGALQEATRERVPLQWAMTQNNLAMALRVLGERERGTAHLEEAVTAFQAALQERTRERVPLQWATTQNNLGLALWRLGERESSTTRLEEAIEAFRAALQERTRERVPLQWAYSEQGLANALRAVAMRQKHAAQMTEALTCMRSAAEVYQQSKETYWLPVAQRSVAEMEAELVELQR
jgi:tetratricopeptide (TPR) repeat protein